MFVGLTRLDDGSTIKEFELREQEFALQSIVRTVTNEDVRFMVRPLPPLSLLYLSLTSP